MSNICTRLTEPLFSLGETYIGVPRLKGGSLQRTGASVPGVYGSSVWDPKGFACSSGGIRKRSKAHCQICINRELHL